MVSALKLQRLYGLVWFVVLPVLVSGCKGYSGESSLKSGEAKPRGQSFARERAARIENELENWYTTIGVTPEERQELKGQLEEHYQEFLNADEPDTWGLLDTVIETRVDFFYGADYPEREQLLELYGDMIWERITLETFTLPEFEGTPVYLPWAAYLGELEVLLADFTQDLRDLLGADFSLGFSRLGEEEDLFTILDLKADQPVDPLAERDYLIFPHDLIPQNIWAINFFPKPVMEKIAELDQADRDENDGELE